LPTLCTFRIFLAARGREREQKENFGCRGRINGIKPKGCRLSKKSLLPTHFISSYWKAQGHRFILSRAIVSAEPGQTLRYSLCNSERREIEENWMKSRNRKANAWE
jgi:hypothetical protein